MIDPLPPSNDRSAAAIVASCQVVTFPALSFLTQNLSRMPQVHPQWLVDATELGSWIFV